MSESSRWSTQRSGWYRGAALTEIRSATGWIVLVFALSSLIAIVKSLDDFGTLASGLLMGAGTLGAVLALGVWQGRRWAGRIAGVLALAVTLLGVVALIVDNDVSLFSHVSRALIVVFWGAGALFLLRPSTQRLFEQARTGEPARPREGEESGSERD